MESADENTQNTENKKRISEKSQILLWTAIIGVIGNIVVAGIGIFGTHAAASAGKADVTKEANRQTDRIASNSVPVGTIIAYGGEPHADLLKQQGWLLCDGTPAYTNEYNALFQAIGYSWGHGNTSDGFNLPDLRGMFLRGVNGIRNDDFGDPDKDSRTNLPSGGDTGNAVGSLQLDMFKAHQHGMSGSKAAYPPGGSLIFMLGATTFKDFDPSEGGNETRPKNAYVYYFIKYQ